MRRRQQTLDCSTSAPTACRGFPWKRSLKSSLYSSWQFWSFAGYASILPKERMRNRENWWTWSDPRPPQDKPASCLSTLEVSSPNSQQFRLTQSTSTQGRPPPSMTARTRSVSPPWGSKWTTNQIWLHKDMIKTNNEDCNVMETWTMWFMNFNYVLFTTMYLFYKFYRFYIFRQISRFIHIWI